MIARFFILVVTLVSIGMPNAAAAQGTNSVKSSPQAVNSYAMASKSVGNAWGFLEHCHVRPAWEVDALRVVGHNLISQAEPSNIQAVGNALGEARAFGRTAVCSDKAMVKNAKDFGPWAFVAVTTIPLGVCGWEQARMPERRAAALQLLTAEARAQAESYGKIIYRPDPCPKTHFLSGPLPNSKLGEVIEYYTRRTFLYAGRIGETVNLAIAGIRLDTPMLSPIETMYYGPEPGLTAQRQPGGRIEFSVVNGRCGRVPMCAWALRAGTLEVSLQTMNAKKGEIQLFEPGAKEPRATFRLTKQSDHHWTLAGAGFKELLAARSRTSFMAVAFYDLDYNDRPQGSFARSDGIEVLVLQLAYEWTFDQIP